MLCDPKIYNWDIQIATIGGKFSHQEVIQSRVFFVGGRVVNWVSVMVWQKYCRITLYTQNKSERDDFLGPSAYKYLCSM